MDGMVLWLLVLACVCVAYLLLKFIRLCSGDGDLTVLGSKMKPEYFQGRVVWVTGASSGIGEELCYLLSEMGSKVVLSARNEKRLEEVKSKLAHPENARVLPVDLSNPDETRSVTNKAKALFGKIDILINNAGISTRAFFVDVQEHVHRQVMEVDLFAPWILTHDTIKGMINEGFGHVVNVSSIAGKVGGPRRSSYCSAKFAMFGLMDSIRYEMQGHNVFVTNVAPGPVVTNVSKNALKGDGTKFGVTDKLIASGMSAKRCAELTLIGVSNQQNEIWISPQPILMAAYLVHYCPPLLYYIVRKQACKELEVEKKSH